MRKLAKITGCLLILCLCSLSVAPMLGMADEAEVSSESDGSLVNGMVSSEVSYMQQALSDLGYLDSVIDGYFGSETEAALVEFQTNNGLYADGVAGLLTLDVLYSGNAVPSGNAASSESTEPSDSAETSESAEASDTAEPESSDTVQPAASADDLGSAYLVVGMYGDAVTKVQQRLSDLGYSVDIDGYYGTYTQAVVKEYQSAEGLYADGEAGPATIAKLFEQAVVPATTNAHSGLYLMQGSTGEDVRRLQIALESLGYNCGGVDGIYGAATAAAVREFQTAQNLYVDGEAGPATLALILPNDQDSTTPTPSDAETPTVSWDYSDVYLVVGATGDSVVIVQKMLTKLGYYNDVCDGYYGPYTAQAIQSFQEAQGLYADGEAGPVTIAQLVALAPSELPTIQPAIQINSTLNPGMTGDEVVNLQKLLSSLGFQVSINGTYDQATSDAVRKFQLFNELSQNGNVDESTRTALNTGSAAGYSAVTQGTTSRSVAVFQNMLNQLGYNVGTADGYYGLSTKKAIREFQLYNNITPDGTLNDITVSTLLNNPVSYSDHTPLQQSNSLSVAPYGEDSSRLLITWTEVPGADGYYLFRSEGTSGDYQLVNITETALKYVDMGLDPSTNYSYYVLAYTGDPLTNISDKQYIAVSNTGSGSTPAFSNPYLYANTNVSYFGNTVYASSATDAAAAEIYKKLQNGENFYICVNNGADPYTVFYGLKDKVSALNDIGLGFVSIQTSTQDDGSYFLVDAETYNYMYDYISMAYKERMEEYGIYLESGKSQDYFFDHHTETSYDNDYIASYRDNLFETPYGTAFKNLSTESKFLFTTPGTNMVMRTDYMIFDLDYNTVGESAIDIIMKMANKTAVGVCRHFALAVDTVCDYLDIPCWTPVDYGYNHQWAIVQTRNNSGGTQYYLVDNQNVVSLDSEDKLKYRPVEDMIWDYTPATKTAMGDAYPW